MARQINIPPQYSARVGGNGINWKTITVDADSDFMAARELVNYGIPFAAANSFGTSTIPGTGAEGITALEAITPKTGRSKQQGLILVVKKPLSPLLQETKGVLGEVKSLLILDLQPQLMPLTPLK